MSGQDFEKTGEKQLDVLVNGAGILKKQELHPQDRESRALVVPGPELTWMKSGQARR